MAKTETKETGNAPEHNTNQEQTTLAMQQEIDVLKAQKANADKTIANLQKQITELQQNAAQHDPTISKLQEQIDILTRDKDALQLQLNNSAHAQANDAEVDKLEEQLLNKNEEVKQLQLTIQNLKQQIQDEQNAHQATTNAAKEKMHNLIDLAPIALKVVNAVAAALSLKYGRPITPRDVIGDYILRYNIQRWSQWFHPFVLSDEDIIAIAQQENEEIRNIQQLKKALHIKDQV